MKPKKAYETLWSFQKWRLDNTFHSKYEMPDPGDVTKAIAAALELMKQNLKK